MKQGIYCIENKNNGKKYIGSSINCEGRKRRHFSELKNIKHKNRKLQNSFNKHGIESFIFYIIENVDDKNNLIKREQHYLDTVKPQYNINKIANSCLGVKRSKETIERMRKAVLGIKHPEWRNKIKSEAQGGDNHWAKNKKFSKKHRKKISDAQIELYKNGYVSPRKGKRNSDKSISLMIDKLSIPLIQYDLNNKFVKEWKNGTETSVFGFSPSNIAQCCKGKRKTHKGFIWEYKK